MRTSKRWLAGAAAGALAAGLIPFVAAGTASAAEGTAAVTPIRATFTGSSLDAVPFGLVAWNSTGTGGVYVDDTSVLTILSAPSSAATITINNDDDDTVSLSNNNLTLDDTAMLSGVLDADDSAIQIKVDTAGTYVGKITDAGGGNAINFSFTTSGKPTSMELTPATQTVLEGGTAELTVSLKDAAGNLTQPTTVDSVAMTDNTDDTVAPATVTDDSLAYGAYEGVTLTTTGTGPGTSTVTATPLGTLAATGVTAVTATVTKSGTISSDAVTSIKVTAPTNAISSPTNADDTVVRTVEVPQNTNSLTVVVDDTSGNDAGETIRLAVWVSGTTGGTINGAAATSSAKLNIDLTTDANKQATTTLSLGGAAIINPSVINIQQVDVSDAQVGGSDVTVSQVVPQVSASTITVSPSGTNVAQLGATTAVTVTVDDSFGTAQAGWTVRAYRKVGGSNFATLLGTATTNSEGAAALSVTNTAGAVTGTVEEYNFQAIPPIGSTVNVTGELSIEYTTSGDVTSLSVAINNPTSGVTTPITNSTTTIASIPYIYVPGAGVVDTSATGTYDQTAATGSAGGNYVVFTPTADPLNAVTVTVPEGVKVSDKNPATTPTLWSGGSQSVQVASAAPVYVFATAVGTHDITFTSGTKTAVAKVKVATAPQFSYNIAITPETQTLAVSQFGTVTVTVTDVFGNPVPGTSDDTGGVTVTASGEVLLSGLQATQKVNTGTDGTATVTVIAGNAGTGTLTATPTNATAASNAPAYRPVFTPPTGAPAPVLSDVASVTVTSAPTEQTITITGERGTVRGKPGIIVDGVTTGFDEGAIVRPWVKFPGQTEYSLGVREIKVDADGEFLWQRRTGKKIYIIIKSEDESVRSNRIIIPAK